MRRKGFFLMLIHGLFFRSSIKLWSQNIKVESGSGARIFTILPNKAT